MPPLFSFYSQRQTTTNTNPQPDVTYRAEKGPFDNPVSRSFSLSLSLRMSRVCASVSLIVSNQLPRSKTPQRPASKTAVTSLFRTLIFHSHPD